MDNRTNGAHRHPGGKQKEERPKTFGEAMRRVGKVIGGFFSRLGYIFKLVWETRPWILFAMLGLAILEGALPVVKALAAAEILNDYFGGK